MTAEGGSFVRWCIEDHLGVRAAPALEAAVRHRRALLRRYGRTPALPRALLEEAAEEATWVGVRLSLPPASALSLEREAARQRVTVDRVLTHALFVYLSALDSGELG
jgi:hypothetical protein